MATTTASANNCINGASRALIRPPLCLPSTIVNLQRNPTFSNSTSSSISINSSSKHSRRRRMITKVSPTSSSSAPVAVVVDETTSSTSELTASPFTVSTGWVEFASLVSGEWDGYGADFSSDGEPFELPESVVPEAFREWEVKVFDWQTQCPTLAQPDDSSLFYKLIKLLPTVGCEADAATRYTIDERKIGGADNSVSAFAYQSSGSYVAIWPSTRSLFEIEHCLIDPNNREVRVRIIQAVHFDNSRFTLRKIKVFCEQWYGPFRNGEQLGGCAIRDSAFASTKALELTEVAGAWQGLHAVANFENSPTSVVQELVDDNSVRKSVKDEDNTVLLPKKLWCSLKEGEDGEAYCEAGWLLEQGQAITSKCSFSSDARIKEIAIARETAESAQ